MRSLLKSPLKTLNRIGKVGPRIGRATAANREVRNADTSKRSGYVKILKFIKKSTSLLSETKLPSEQKLKKIANFQVEGGGGGGGLLGLLGLGGLTAGLFGAKLPKIDVPGINPFRRGPGRGRQPQRGRQPGQRGRRPGTRGDRIRDSRNQSNRRRTRNRTTQRQGRVPSRAEQRYRRRFGDRAGDRKYGKLNQGRVQGRDFRSPFRQRQNITGTGADRFRRGVRQRIPGQGARVTGGNVDRALNTRGMQAARRVGKFGLQGGKAVLGASKATLKVFRRVPVIGALLAGALTYFQDIEGGNDPDLPGGGPDGKPDRNLSRALFSAGGAALGGIIGTFIPIPVIGTLMGGIIGEYIGDLTYELVRGGGFTAVSQKLKDDLGKLFRGGSAIVKWAIDGFGRLKQGMPKIKLPFGIPGIGREVLDLRPGSIVKGLRQLPKAFFTRIPMNESTAEKAERLRKEGEEKNRKIGQKATLLGKPVIWDGARWVPEEAYTSMGDGADPLLGTQEIDEGEEDLGLTPMSRNVGGLTNIVPTANLMAKGVYAGDNITNKVGMTSGRGYRWGRMHRGVDIGTNGERGFYVALKLKGVVSDTGTFSGYGKTVVITSGNKDYLFAHLAQITVQKGQPYNGQIIGEIGNTGAGTGIHLHFEVSPKGTGGYSQDQDPMPYVKYLAIGRLDPNAPKQQTLLADAETDTTTTSDDTSDGVNPTAEDRQLIATDPRKTAKQDEVNFLMENLAKLSIAFGMGGGQQTAQGDPDILPVPIGGDTGGTKKSRNLGQDRASSDLLNNYWETTLLSKLSNT